MAASDNVAVMVDKMTATKKVATDVPNNPPLLNRIPADLQSPTVSLSGESNDTSG